MTTDCTPVAWPGERTTAWHEREPSGEVRNWFGSLVDGMRHASGQMYTRNRYYDPKTGQFTQSDPIGLAGRLKRVRVANGDPVSYSDPYGSCSTLINKQTGESQAGPTDCKLKPLAVTVYRLGYSDEDIEEALLAATGGGVGGVVRSGIGKVAGPVRAGIRRFLGRGNPTKLNRGGIPQPYNAADGRFLPYDANPGILRGPVGEITKGIGEGRIEAISQAPPGGEPPPNLPRAIGRVIGHAIAKLFGT